MQLLPILLSYHEKCLSDTEPEIKMHTKSTQLSPRPDFNESRVQSQAHTVHSCEFPAHLQGNLSVVIQDQTVSVPHSHADTFEMEKKIKIILKQFIIYDLGVVWRSLGTYESLFGTEQQDLQCFSCWDNTVSELRRKKEICSK